MRPVRFAASRSLDCPLVGSDGPRDCLERLTRTIAARLAGRFRGRARIVPDVVTYQIDLTLVDPLLDGESQGEHVIEASLTLRVQEIDGVAARVSVVPRVVAELYRRRPIEPWTWIEQDRDDKLGSFLGEIDAALAELREAAHED